MKEKRKSKPKVKKNWCAKHNHPMDIRVHDYTGMKKRIFFDCMDCRSEAMDKIMKIKLKELQTARKRKDERELKVRMAITRAHISFKAIEQDVEEATKTNG